MRRWINAHKLATLGIVVGAALVAGSLVARTSSGNATAEPPRGSPTRSADTWPPSSRPDAAAAGGGQATSPIPTTDGAPSELAIDPSGLRRDRSEGGARQVGLDYLGAVQQRFLYLTAESGRELLEAWQAPGVELAELDRTVERFSELRAALTAGGGDVWWVVSPLAVRVEAYAPERARVAVWTATVTASGADPATGGEVVVPTVDYRVSTVELLWTDDVGWSVWSVTDAAGPVPMLATGAVQSSPSEFLSRLDGFQLVREHR